MPAGIDDKAEAVVPTPLKSGAAYELVVEVAAKSKAADETPSIKTAGQQADEAAATRAVARTDSLEVLLARSVLALRSFFAGTAKVAPSSDDAATDGCDSLRDC